MSKIKLTKKSYNGFLTEINRLHKKIETITNSLSETAQEYGYADSQYFMLLEEKANTEEILERYNEIVRNVELLKHNAKIHKVELGSIVRLVNHKVCYQFTLVSEYEADPLKKQISDLSPIGKSIIGHSVGEVVNILTPQGVSEFTIENVM